MKTVATALLVISLLALSRIAKADDALAREHFRQGVELYDKRQYEPALASFEKAYAEKPSPGIKRNIALCLKGLGRMVEAATAFDEALDEGEGSLKPDVRAAMERQLAELSKDLATVHITIVEATSRKPVDDVVVTVDDKALRQPALRRPIRLAPGIHVFSARSARFADPPDKKLSILAGSPVDATFELTPAAGDLTVFPSVKGATIEVDGTVITSWPLRLPAGSHRVVVAAPGYPTATADVVVSAGSVVEYPITLSNGPPAPYDAPLRKPPPAAKRRYLVPMISYLGQSFRFSPAVGDERAGGAKRYLTGAAIGLRGGYFVSRLFALELVGEVGQVGATYGIVDKASATASRVTEWQLAPALRFGTRGSFRVTAATGIGIQGTTLKSDIGAVPPSAGRQLKAGGVGAVWLIDLAVQLDVGSVFLEGALVGVVHGVASVHDEATDARVFYSSPSLRSGARLGLGIPF